MNKKLNVGCLLKITAGFSIYENLASELYIADHPHGDKISEQCVLTFLGYDKFGRAMILYDNKILYTYTLQHFIKKKKIEVI